MAKLTLAIGNKNRSSWSLRPWLALRQAGIAFTEVALDLDQRPAFMHGLKPFAPARKVPALRIDDVVVWESLAILETIAELYPESRLWPADAAARSLARAVSAEMHAGFAALRSNMPMNVVAELPGQNRKPEVAEDIERILALWRHCRERHGQGGAFLFGRFSIADAMFAPVVTRLRSYGVELPEPAASYAGAVWALPAMQDWVAGARAEVRA